MKSKMSIRFKLALLLIALLVGVIATIAITVFSSYSSRLDIQLEEASAAKMDAAAAKIDSWHLVNAQNIKTLRNEALHRIDNIKTILPSLIKGVKDDPALSAMYFCDALSYQKGGIWIESSGWVPPPEWDQYVRGWFLNAMKSPEPALTAPYIDGITGKLVVTVAVRIDDASGKTR